MNNKLHVTNTGPNGANMNNGANKVNAQKNNVLKKNAAANNDI